jgi:hypothetical protein
VDNATKKEVEMFLVAIDKNPPTMNLDGYANINRGLITAVSAKFKNKIPKRTDLLTAPFLCRTFRSWPPIWWC